jgi:hypothetical protein
MSPIDTDLLLGLLGRSADDPVVEQFLVERRIHDRPKTLQQLADDEFIEDDDEADMEYELERAAQDSLIVQSERLGLCLMFQPRQNFALVNAGLPESQSPFVLEEVGLFAKGVQIYQQYSGALPEGVSFSTRRSDAAYAALGSPIASRNIHETPTDLFVLHERIVNFGFAEGDIGTIALVHVRNKNDFDRKMLRPNFDGMGRSPLAGVLGARQVGETVVSRAVQELFSELAIDADDMYDGVCPEEITRLTQSHGITLYFQTPSQQGTEQKPNIASGQRLAGVTFKRRGDLGSLGYHGALPFAFEFGDTPQTQTIKTARPPDREHQSDELQSYYWKTESGVIVQAVSSLIDWQLCRVTLHAPFVAAELGFAA